MKRLTLTALLAALLFLPARGRDDDEPQEFATAKEALQALNDYIGTWKGSGAPEGKARPAAGEVWSETIDWSWRFKGDDAWLTVAFKNGRHFKSGEVRYLTGKKAYQLTLVDRKNKKRVFEGKPDKGYLTFERVDPDTAEAQQLRMNLAGSGDRFVYRYARKPEGRTIFLREYQVGATKEGVSLAAKEKKIECVVSGGLGTTPVSFGGKTYYVCCSGCRDAFNDNPAKYVKEFEEKQKKKAE